MKVKGTEKMDMSIDPKKLEEAIIRQVADQILDADEGEAFTRYQREIRKEINERIDRLFRERVESEVTNAITTVTKDGFDREYQAVDSFGQPNGDKTTIRKRLARMSKEYWSKRVDKNGKEITSTYGDNMSRAEWTMMKACGEDFGKQLKQEAVNVSAALKDGLRQEMRNWIDRSLGDLFKVQSEMDKEEKRRI